MGVTPHIRITEADEALHARFTVWLQMVVRHATLDYIRRQRHLSHEVSISELPEDFCSVASDAPVNITDGFQFEEQRLSDAFVQLPLMRRKILEMLFVEDLTPAKVAEALNCSVEYVYKQKYYALKRLRALLTGETK